MTPNSSPPPNDEGEYEPISKTEDTGDQLIGKFQNNRPNIPANAKDLIL